MRLHDIFSKSSDKKQSKSVIVVDHREKNSLVVSELIKRNLSVEFKQLPVADYLINNTAIERKTLSDCKASIINKRIFNQLEELKQYPQHCLILEGLATTDPYAGPIHENAFRGFLLTAALQHNVPIIFTLNEQDTAKYIDVLARKPKGKETAIRATKTLRSHKEQLQFILEGFPGIGPSAAKKLLDHFKTLHAIANASHEELKELLSKKAGAFYDLLHKEIK